VITRYYFERPVSVAADPEAGVRLRIDPVDPPIRRRRGLTPCSPIVSTGVTRWVRANTLGMPAPGQGPELPFVSRVPNVLPRPTSFRTSGIGTMGAVDLHYAMAPFLLQPDQVLVMEGRLPPCRFASVVLWNMHMQTLEYRHHRTSLNRAQLRLERDGSFRVGSHIATPASRIGSIRGHGIGIVFWRIVLPQEEPGEIAATWWINEIHHGLHGFHGSSTTSYGPA
jgi:hypothetical protein